MKLKETLDPLQKGNEQCKKSLNQQRKDRLNDSVCEYLEDDNPEIFWREFNDCLVEWISYHKGQSDRASLMKKMIGGHRPLQIQQDLETQTSLLQKKAMTYETPDARNPG